MVGGTAMPVQCGFDFGLRIEDDTIIDNQIAQLRPWLARWLVVAVLPCQFSVAPPADRDTATQSLS